MCGQDVATCATSEFENKVIMDLLAAHIKAIRAVDRYTSARIYVFIENNYGGYVMSTHLAEMLQNPHVFGAIEIYGEIDGGVRKPGFWTTEPLKESAVEGLRQILKHNMLHYAEEYVSNTSRADAVSRTQLQLSKFRREIKEDKFDPFKEPKEKLTGKKSGPDDMVICLALSVEFSVRTRKTRSFIQECRSNGWNTGDRGG